MKLPKIIYEDKNVFVFNKPAGLLVHGDGRTSKESEVSYGAGSEETFADMLAAHYPKMKKIGEPICSKGKDGKEKIIYRPGIVHRLDRGTTGVLVVAKNQKSFESLKKQFQDRTVVKKYIVVVHGKMKDVRGIIDRPIGRSRNDFRKWSAMRGTRGEIRPAVTEYKVLKNFSQSGEDFTVLDVSPKTGRTHQIRVHLKAINHPVVGDSLYAGNKRSTLGFKRPALHAVSVTFSSLKGKKISVEAPMPKDFSFLRKLV